MKRNLETNGYWAKRPDDAELYNSVVASLTAAKEAYDEGDYDDNVDEYDENVYSWYNR